MRFASKIACKSEICCNFGVKSDENGAQFGAKWSKMMRFDKIPPIRALKCDKMMRFGEISTNPRPKMWWNVMKWCDDDGIW